MDIAKFREDFPEFSSETDYPDARVQFYLDLASKLLDPCKWGDLLDYGIELFVAHALVTDKKNRDAAAAGTEPGAASGNITTKSVGGVSVSYGAYLLNIYNAGYWNSTSYGIQYYQMMRRMGIGAIQL